MPSGGIPPKEHRWKPGQSGNPQGGRKHDPEMKAFARLTKEELKDVAALILKGDLTELERMSNDKTQIVLKVMVASVAAKIMKKGDMHALDLLLNRLIGKVKQEIGIEGDFPSNQVVITIPSNGREVKNDKSE